MFAAIMSSTVGKFTRETNAGSNPFRCAASVSACPCRCLLFQPLVRIEDLLRIRRRRTDLGHERIRKQRKWSDQLLQLISGRYRNRLRVKVNGRVRGSRGGGKRPGVNRVCEGQDDEQPNCGLHFLLHCPSNGRRAALSSGAGTTSVILSQYLASPCGIPQ